MRIKAEEFIAIWQSSKTVKEVSAKTGLLCGTAISRARHYRSKGVELKKLYRDHYDWEALAKLAKEANNG